MSKELIEKLRKGLNNKHLSDAQKKSIKAKIESLEKLEKKSEKAKPTKKVVEPKKEVKAKPAKKEKVSTADKKEFNRHRVGRSKDDLAKDSKRIAMKGGKRISENGNVYYERRPNRSDVNPRKKFEDGGNVDSDTKYIVVDEKILAATIPNRFNNTKGTDEAEVIAVAPSEIGFTKLGDVFFLKNKKVRPATSADFEKYKVAEPKSKFSKGGTVVNLKDTKGKVEFVKLGKIKNGYGLGGSSEGYVAMKDKKVLFLVGEDKPYSPLGGKETLQEIIDTTEEGKTYEWKSPINKFEDGGNIEPTEFEVAADENVEKMAKGGNVDILEKKAIEYIIGREIGDFHKESKSYAYKFPKGNKWFTIPVRDVENVIDNHSKSLTMAKGGNIDDDVDSYISYASVRKGFDLYYYDVNTGDFDIYAGNFNTLEELDEQAKKDGKEEILPYRKDDLFNNSKFAKGGSIATCPVGTKIQTIIFSKEFYNKVRAVKWLNKNNFKGTIADDKSTTVRFRQASPDKFKEDTFRTIELTKGVKAVIGCPKK